MTFEDLDACRKARLLVNAIYALRRGSCSAGDAGALVSGLIGSTRRRLAGKIAGSAARLVLVGGWGLSLFS
jgi:hypothetical protein